MRMPPTCGPASPCCCCSAAAVQDGLPGALPAYRGTVDAVRTIVAREGWLGLYAGLAPSMLGSSERRGNSSSSSSSSAQGIKGCSERERRRGGGEQGAQQQK
jgi:hypothetical protein